MALGEPILRGHPNGSRCGSVRKSLAAHCRCQRSGSETARFHQSRDRRSSIAAASISCCLSRSPRNTPPLCGEVHRVESAKGCGVNGWTSLNRSAKKCRTAAIRFSRWRRATAGCCCCSRKRGRGRDVLSHGWPKPRVEPLAPSCGQQKANAVEDCLRSERLESEDEGLGRKPGKATELGVRQELHWRA